MKRVFDLLDGTFPGFGEVERACRARGVRWEECTTPFVVEDEGRVVAHVGVLEIPLVVGGREVLAGGLHSVATQLAYRGRELSRTLMQEALAHCDARYQTVVLTAGQPQIYERHGFRVVPEHRFLCDSPPTAGHDGWRTLDLAASSDLELLHTLLRERAPVSSTLGVVRELPVFTFDTARATLSYFHDLDAVVWFTVKDRTLLLHDVVARQVPPLRDILARVSGPVERVECYFVPDRLDAPFSAEPWLFDGEQYLMARGPFVEAGSPVILPRSARC